jgi:hypothetical protein
MDQQGEWLFGGYYQFQSSKFSYGLTGWWTRYSKPIRKDNPDRYRFSFRGKENAVIGFHYNWQADPLMMNGEFASSRNGGLAFICNSHMDLLKMILVVSLRYAHPRFHNPRSMFFGNRPANNQAALYFGLKSRGRVRIQWSIQYELFRRPWRTYFIPLPPSGNELMFYIKGKWSTCVHTRFQVRFQSGEKIRNADQYQSINPLINTRNHTQLRLDLLYRGNIGFHGKIRLEKVWIRYPQIRPQHLLSELVESGYLLYMDARLAPKSLWMVSIRWIFFNTPSYDSRIYEYESDCPGMFTLPSLFGRGIRWYLFIKCQLTSKLSMAVKYSNTKYSSSKQSSSYTCQHRIHFQIDLHI